MSRRTQYDGHHTGSGAAWHRSAEVFSHETASGGGRTGRLLAVLIPRPALAHCDTLDGPVVKDGRRRSRRAT